MTTSDSSGNRAGDRHAQKSALQNEVRASRRAVLVVNTRSRRGARAYSEAKRRLTKAGLTVDASYPVRHAERLPELVRQIAAQGHKFIIVGGGDGTISSVVDHLAYTNIVCGLLPLSARPTVLPVRSGLRSIYLVLSIR